MYLKLTCVNGFSEFIGRILSALLTFVIRWAHQFDHNVKSFDLCDQGRILVCQTVAEISQNFVISRAIIHMMHAQNWILSRRRSYFIKSGFEH